MKFTYHILFLFIVITSCSSDSANEAINEFKYEYEIIPIPLEKVIVERGFTTNKVYGTKAYSYTIDTLEIKLNSGIAGPVSIEANTYLNPNTSSARNTPPHVNYLYFSDLKSTWSDNDIKNIFFVENNSGGQYTTITYSKCNINLSQRPELFVLNSNIPTYATLEIKDEPVFERIQFSSNVEYSINEVILYKNVYVKVLQKKAL